VTRGDPVAGEGASDLSSTDDPDFQMGLGLGSRREGWERYKRYASWDSLTALENWVERGVAPSAQIVSDSVGVPGRTRPLCEYPRWPKYRGTGDVNSAASFDCASGDLQ